jgi:hypothetical protein
LQHRRPPSSNPSNLVKRSSVIHEAIRAFRNAWPLAAVCCFGILGFLIAGTIVLALIPLYLSTKTVAPVANTNGEICSLYEDESSNHCFFLAANDTFYIQYSANAPDSDNTGTGSVTDLDNVRQELSHVFTLLIRSHLSVGKKHGHRRFVRHHRWTNSSDI